MAHDVKENSGLVHYPIHVVGVISFHVRCLRYGPFDQNLVYSPNYFKLEVRRHEAYLNEASTKCWNECVLTLSPTSSLHSHKQPIKHLPKAPTHQTSGSPRTTVPPFRGWVGKRATHVTLYMPFSLSLSHTHTHNGEHGHMRCFRQRKNKINISGFIDVNMSLIIKYQFKCFCHTTQPPLRCLRS